MWNNRSTNQIFKFYVQMILRDIWRIANFAFVCYCCWFWCSEYCIYEFLGGKINEERNWKFNLNLCNSRSEIWAWKGLQIFNIVVCGLQQIPVCAAFSSAEQKGSQCGQLKRGKFSLCSNDERATPDKQKHKRNYCNFACSTIWFPPTDYYCTEIVLARKNRIIIWIERKSSIRAQVWKCKFQF